MDHFNEYLNMKGYWILTPEENDLATRIRKLQENIPKYEKALGILINMKIENKITLITNT